MVPKPFLILIILQLLIVTHGSKNDSFSTHNNFNNSFKKSSKTNDYESSETVKDYCPNSEIPCPSIPKILYNKRQCYKSDFEDYKLLRSMRYQCLTRMDVYENLRSKFSKIQIRNHKMRRSIFTEKVKVWKTQKHIFLPDFLPKYKQTKIA